MGKDKGKMIVRKLIQYFNHMCKKFNNYKIY